MSYNKYSRGTGARASAVPLPPPPSLTDLAEWPYLESSAARTRTRNAHPAVTLAIGDSGSKRKHSAASSTALAPSAGDSSSTQQSLGYVNGRSLPQQDEYSMVTEQGTANLPQQVVLERKAQDQNKTAAQQGSGMAQEKGEYKAIWDDPNAAYPVTWWKKLPMGVDVEQAVELWVRKGRIDCAICGTRHPPPHDMAVQRRNLEKAAMRRKHKLEQGSSASASRAPSSASRRNKRRDEDKASERCQLCGNLHSGPCRAPLCVSCGQYHFQKKGTACTRRGWAAVPEMPSAEQQRRNSRAAILSCRTEEQVQFWTELLKDHLPGPELPQQQQQQQQQSRSPPRQNQRGRPNQRARGRSASPRGEESGGGGSYRQRSPNTRRNANKRGGRGPG